MRSPGMKKDMKLKTVHKCYRGGFFGPGVHSGIPVRTPQKRIER